MLNHRWVITPNRRLASFLSKRFKNPGSEYMAQAINICSWQDAVLQCRLDHPLVFTKALLSPWQSRFLWQGVIRQSIYADGFINLADTQRLASAAIDLCVNWLIDPSEFKALKHESEVLHTWWLAYQHECHARQKMDQGMLAQTMLRAAQAGQLDYANIDFYGFDDFTPLQAAFISAMKQHGCEVNVQQGDTYNSEPRVIQASDPAHECYVAIKHAQAQLEHHPAGALPIGIVIPDIQQRWIEISDMLERVFVAEPSPPYNISSGMTLYEYPAVGCACEILMQVLSDQISSERLSYLLNTPFIQADPIPLRSQYDMELRQSQAMSYDLATLINESPMPLGFRKCLETLRCDVSETRSVSSWADLMMSILRGCGWPGAGQLSSVTYQAVEQYYEVVAELRTLDAVSTKVDYETAVHQLISALKQSLFQPESEDKPIQVLGMLEAAGLTFSDLFICGMSDTAMPAAPNPNPFIPVQIQKSHDMPHASPAREWAFSQKIINRFASSASQVVFSYPAHNKEGYEQRPSFFIQQYPHQSLDNTGEHIHAELDLALLNSESLDMMPTEGGLPLQGGFVRGGAGMIEAQLACPFKAYVKYRLRAASPEPAAVGLSMKLRGKLLHAIMEAVLNHIRSSERLRSLTAEESHDLIMRIIDQELSRLQPPLDASLRIIESERLLNIISLSLSQERERANFTLKGMEIPVEINLSGLKIKLRIDRWDQTADGALLIDYKTGKINVNAWEPDRFDNPQLPLYAMALDEPPAGVAYAMLRKEEVSFKGQGILTMNGIETLSEEGWHEKLAAWRGLLLQTAADILSGQAQVFPKYGPQTCKHCDFSLVCRVSEQENIHD